MRSDRELLLPLLDSHQEFPARNETVPGIVRVHFDLARVARFDGLDAGGEVVRELDVLVACYEGIGKCDGCCFVSEVNWSVDVIVCVLEGIGKRRGGHILFGLSTPA